MFRRRSNTLPKDPEFPADLKKLGYFINQNDQIRSIAHPTQDFNFFISKNERVLEVHREAMNTCIRTHLAARFVAAGLSTTRLRGSSPISSPTITEPHVPILTTANLATASRILLYFGESSQDLGIFAYRTIGHSSLAAGSILDFVAAIKAHEASPLAGKNEAKGGEIALVVANPGQLIWYRRGARAVTHASWDALPRKTGVDQRMRIDPVRNRVEGHRDGPEHLRSVMEYVRAQMKEGAQLEIAAVGDGVEVVVSFLDGNWAELGERVAALCVGPAYLWKVQEEVIDEGFRTFWAKVCISLLCDVFLARTELLIRHWGYWQRARAYLIHHEPLGTPLYGREKIGCNCFSSGENAYVECIMPQAHTSMLDFFQLVHNHPEYEEQLLLIGPDEGNSDRVVKWEDVRDSEIVEGMRQELITVSKIE